MNLEDPRVLAQLAAALCLFGATFALIAWRRARAALVAAEARPKPGLRTTPGGGPATTALWRRLIAPVARLLRPSANERDELAAKLLQAGRVAPGELERFLEEKAAFMLVGLAGAAMAWSAIDDDTLKLLSMLIFLLAGLILPKRRLDTAALERREAVFRALPGAVDLLMTCVDAGLSIEQAIARVARESRASSPILAAELGMTAQECDAGVSLSEALRRLSRRIDLDDLAGLCAVIVQAYELGAPIVQTLGDYAESTRKKRMAMLDERAGKLVTKLTFPLALFLLPAALVAMLGAAALQLIAALG